MTTALVTGASGFIGGRLCRRLLDDGVQVAAISREPRADEELRWLRVELSDADAVSGALERVRPDTVYHLAGHVSGSRDLAAVGPSVRDNLVAAVNVLVAAARAGTPVVVAGSMEEPSPGLDDPVPASPYAAAKQAVGSFGRMLAALHELPVVNLRIFMVYGPGQADRSKLVPYIATSLLEGVRPKLSSGVRPVDWVYVDDVVDAFVAAGARPDLSGRTLDIGSGELVTVREIVELLVAIVGGDVQPEFGAIADRPLEVVRVADVETTRSLLGWEPRTPLADGLRATVDWYRRELAATDAHAEQR